MKPPPFAVTYSRNNRTIANQYWRIMCRISDGIFVASLYQTACSHPPKSAPFRASDEQHSWSSERRSHAFLLPDSSSATPKPILDVAFMGAILPLRISIDRKRLLAHRANEVVICFSLHLVEMAVPPFPPAAVGAELLFLSASGLFYRLS